MLMLKLLCSSPIVYCFLLKVASNNLTAEEYFCTDGTIDIGSGQKLTIYISSTEILQVHRNILENLDDLVRDKKD